MVPQNPCERLRVYISNFKYSLKTLKVLSNDAIRVVNLALHYLRDPEYYLEKSDCITGLITISYAEGLIDALRMIGAVEWQWLRKPIKIVLAAGSFDILHPGHVAFLKWASTLGDKLYVVIARDSTYKKLRGYSPVLNENERLAIVSAIRYVYEAVVGSESDMLEPVARIKPDIIALGPDQFDEERLRTMLQRKGLTNIHIVRMEQRYSEYSSSRIKEKICDLFCSQVKC
ncbi:MAG TPA: cytidylyltransferase family protein [Ignisphaera sp.]|nr:cytidylyltransferase family protein [Ignisphaera sp.]